MGRKAGGFQRPRLVADRPLPPYRYVPGRNPHPVRDPRGPYFGVAREAPRPPNPKRWCECDAYLFGIDLFNHGYYWEAHEAWEGLWNACGRRGPTATFMKALIGLAAAGFKARLGNRRGVTTHARRAANLFRKTRTATGACGRRYMGLDLRALEREARDAADRASQSGEKESAAGTMAFDILLYPD